jgi:hypothetical protein
LKPIEIYHNFSWWLRYTEFGLWWYHNIEWPFLYPFRCFFNPRHKKLRKAIPKTWSDSTELIRDINFTLLTEFYEDEIGGDKGCQEQEKLNREGNKNSKWADFYNQLSIYYNYITEEREKIEEALNNSYPEKPAKVDWLEWINQPHSYEKRYKKVIEIETYLKKRDTEVLTWIIKNRDGFWT